jgi:hypothetical protein
MCRDFNGGKNPAWPCDELLTLATPVPTIEEIPGSNRGELSGNFGGAFFYPN